MLPTSFLFAFVTREAREERYIGYVAAALTLTGDEAYEDAAVVHKRTNALQSSVKFAIRAYILAICCFSTVNQSLLLSSKLEGDNTKSIVPSPVIVFLCLCNVFVAD